MVERHAMMRQRRCVTAQDVRVHQQRIREFKQKRKVEFEEEEYRQNKLSYLKKLEQRSGSAEKEVDAVSTSFEERSGKFVDPILKQQQEKMKEKERLLKRSELFKQQLI